MAAFGGFFSLTRLLASLLHLGEILNSFKTLLSAKLKRIVFLNTLNLEKTFRHSSVIFLNYLIFEKYVPSLMHVCDYLFFHVCDYQK